MGRTVTPKYAVEVVVRKGYHTPSCWTVKNYGSPTVANLKKWVESFNESIKPGGVNSHLGEGSYILAAQIRLNKFNGAVVALYKPMGAY